MNDFCLALLVFCFFCLAHKHFLGHLRDFIRTIFVEDDNVVEVAAVADKLVFLQARTDKAVSAVDIEFLIGFSYGCCLDGIEVAYFSEAWMLFSVFFLEEFEPVGSNFHQIVQVAGNVFQFLFDFGNQFIGFVFIEFQDALHLDFQ